MTITVLPDGRVSRGDAATFLGVKVKTLVEWDRAGKGPRSWKVGGRRFYSMADLKRYADPTLSWDETGILDQRDISEAGRKNAQIPVRVTPELRNRLRAEAQRNGRSLTQEVEHRLIASLDYADAAEYLGRALGLPKPSPTDLIDRMMPWLDALAEVQRRER